MQASGIEILFKGINFLRLLEGLWMTVKIALISVVLSLILGTLLGIVMTSKNRVIHVITEIYLDFIRIMPQLVLLYIMYYGITAWFGVNLSSWNAAVITFTLWGTAEMADLVRGAITSIPVHQKESAEALGMNSAQVFLYVLLPQTLRRLAAPAINLVTRMIKTTSLVEIISMTEVLKTGQQIIDANRMQYPDGAFWVYGAVFILYFIICWPVSMYAKHLEKKWS